MTQRAFSGNHVAGLRELLARCRQVLAHAWSHRHELTGPARLTSEAAFLPAALSLRETPPHPAPRRALWAICAIFTIAVAWAAIGKVDVVAIAPGRIIVSQRSKVIQPLETATIRAIHVHDGQRVRNGQLLVELDDTQAAADDAQAGQELLSALSETLRADALANAIDTGHSPFLSADRLRELCPSKEARPADCEAAYGLRRQTEAEWEDIRSKRERLTASIDTRAAQVQATQASMGRTEALLISLRQRESDYSQLAQQGFLNQHAYQDKTRDRIDAENEMTRLRAEQVAAVAAHREALKERAAYLAEVRKDLATRREQARRSIAHLKQERVKTGQRRDVMQLRAPADGIVQQLAVHTPGGVVTPALPLMVIVPDEGGVIAEVMVANKDIGFVRPGQPVRLKLETFNFTRYGTLDGELTWVSADALVRDPQSPGGAGSVASNGQAPMAYFPAHIRLEQTNLRVEGKQVPVSAGMNVTAEIRTAQRTLLEYLLSPIQRTLNEAARER